MTETIPKTEPEIQIGGPPEERVFHSRYQLEAVLDAFGCDLGRAGVSVNNIRRLTNELREKYGKNLPLGVPLFF